MTGRAGAPERAAGRLLLGLAGALLLVVVAVPLGVLVRREWAPLVELDLAVTRAAEEAVAGSAALLALARGVTLLGEPVLVTVLPALLAVVLWRSGRRRLAAYVVVVRVGALVLSSGLKLAVERARPVFDEPVATALGHSFPSGHALGGTAFWVSTALVGLALWGRQWRLPLLAGALVVAVLVAASRVLLGVHYASDVTAGTLIALGWVALCTAVFATWRREEGRPVTGADELVAGPGARR